MAGKAKPEDAAEDIPAPRENPELEGHGAAEAALRAAFDGGRLHHAWLISGPKGIGKATLAYRFARYVLANAGAADGGLFGGDLAAPGAAGSLYVAPDDPVFRRVAAGGHADLLSIEKSLNDRGKPRTEIVVDDVRRTQGFFALTAGEGGWRVIVVDAADEMNPNAANALLKVLEEPPDRALIVLVCHNPGRLLPTIRSRCQKLRLEPLATDAVAALAARYLPELAPDEARVIAGLAGGSVGRALDLAGSDGLAVYGRVMELLDGLPALDVAALHEFAQSCGGAKGQGTFETAADLIRWTLARLVRYVGEAGAGSGRIDAREQVLFQRIGPAAGLESWLQVWEKIDDLLDRANRANLDRKQVILNAFSTLQGAVRS